jgi:uncharacterized protein
VIRTAKNKLLINALHLKEGVTKLYLEITNAELEITALKFAGPIILDAELFKSGETIVLSGKINFRPILSCVSCLNEYQKDFSEPIYQEYVRAPKAVIVDSARLEDEDFVREYYNADFFDVTALVRDTILLAVPIAPWCREDCPGVSA